MSIGFSGSKSALGATIGTKGGGRRWRCRWRGSRAYFTGQYNADGTPFHITINAEVIHGYDDIT